MVASLLPGVKMKNLQWKKVNEAKLQNTVWGQPELKNSTNIFSTADFKLIEDLFGETAKPITSPRLNLVNIYLILFYFIYIILLLIFSFSS